MSSDERQHAGDPADPESEGASASPATERDNQPDERAPSPERQAETTSAEHEHQHEESVRGRTYRVRGSVGLVWRLVMGTISLGLILGIWWFVTRGAAEERMVSPAQLGSPAEVFGSFPSLWFDRALMRNTIASVLRVAKGYGLALIVGIPLGVLGGVFPRFQAFIAPVTLFGRNVPIAALIPLTLLWFGIGETQKSMFIFVASVSFVIVDAIQHIFSVHQRYVDTAYTLGANRRQIIFKVLVPLAAPGIFNSVRLLFGLGFGYIILAEVIDLESGVGALIAVSQRRGPKEHVYLILIWMALVAYGIDRALYYLGRWLFPYRYQQ